MNGSLIVLTALALAAGNPESGAQSAGAAEAVTNTEPSAKPSKPICRPVETTATRLGKRKVCKTPEEWKLHDRQSEDGTRGISRSSGSSR
jgi:hypothetical protein